MYWLTCGTLIGANRHQGPIPWDNDADIAVFDHDLERAESILNEMYPNAVKQVVLKKYHCMLKVKFKDLPHVSLDIFSYTRRGDHLELSGKLTRMWYPTETIEMKHLYPRIPNYYKFGNITLAGSPSERLILNSHFPGWNESYVIHPMHSKYRFPFGIFMHKRIISKKLGQSQIKIYS